MNKDIIVKKSKIHEKGAFANKDFRKGEVVLKWHPKILSKSKAEKLPAKYKIYLYKIGNKYLLMQPPEHYVNHSCTPNTKPKGQTDIAIKSIKKGEEITSDYTGSDEIPNNFPCKCKSKNCKKLIL